MRLVAVFTCLWVGLTSSSPPVRGVTNNPPDPALRERLKNALKENGESIRFLENKGQVDNDDVLYYFESSHQAVYIERDRIRFVAIRDSVLEDLSAGDKLRDKRVIAETHTFSLYLQGAKKNPVIRLGGTFSTNYNYCMGKDARHWVMGVKAAKELTLEEIYPGIDLRLYSTADGVIEYDWLMDAGADLDKVRMKFSGQDHLTIGPDGQLMVDLRFSKIRFAIVDCYQVTPEGKLPVNISFRQLNHGTIGFASPSRLDPQYPLVIDPTLTWGTFIDANNSSFDAYLFAIQVDPLDGMVYCAGGTDRQFPTASAPYDADGYLNIITGLNGSPPSPLPMVAVVYRINNTGSDLVDLTLYGPSSVSNPNRIIAQALSLSDNQVFIGGVTNVDIPLAGTPFDSTLDADDGFVAVFSRDLGSLQYATYLGGPGVDDLGVTCIRALTDSTFVVGETVDSILPPGYVDPVAADTVLSGTEMYIAKFSSYHTLDWGTYVGGTGDDVFNDLEVLNDGRVAFAGFGTGTLTEVNSAAGRSTNSDNDGILGVLNNTGSAFLYLDEIGGSGNDRLFDVEVVGDTLYWTGAVSSGFPVSSSGVYDMSFNGSTDVIVGKVFDAGGTGSYAATYYGTSHADLGNGIRLVSQTDCDGNQSVFLLVFGTVSGSGLPVLNINGEPFYRATYTSGGNSGTDMFFAAFNSSLSTLKFGTYMGGNQDDYLGATGVPRGANHLWVNNADVFLGTTTHSATHNPTLVSGGFDTSKSNSGNDSHIVLAISFNTLFASDFSDAPATYGAPAHILDCQDLHIGPLLDLESGPFPGPAANGDDLNALDDEDGVLILPAFSAGGPQNISVDVTDLVNLTGTTANLYAWIDFNSNGQFSSSEFTSTTLGNGFTGSKTLTWTGVTVSGSASSHYLRTRLTTNTLNDNPSTSTLDERSTVPASDGEVEDYRAIELTCPAASVEAACQTQAVIDTKYANWLASVKAGGGCNGVLTNNSTGAPSACGGSVAVTFTYSSSCAPLTTTCSSSFTVIGDQPPILNSCAVTRNISGCNTAAVSDPPYSATLASSSEVEFENAINQGNVVDACGITTVNYIDVAAGACPMTVTRTWTLSDACGNSVTCVQLINVEGDNTPAITTCAVTRNIDGCSTAAVSGPAYAEIPTTSSEAVFENATNQGDASDVCGIVAVVYEDDATGSCPIVVTRTWTLTNACGNSSICNQIIQVMDGIGPVINQPPVSRSMEGCSVPVITDPVYSATLALSDQTQFSNATNQGDASDACGIMTVNYIDVISGTCPILVTRTWMLTDTCGNTSTCDQLIHIVDSSPPDLNCPVDLTLECSSDTSPFNTGSASSTDNCDAAPLITYTDITLTDTTSQANIILRTWTATDLCNNSATCTQIITVVNPLVPSIPGNAFDTICSGQQVVFEAVDPGISPITYEWSFGSGANPLTGSGIGPQSVTYVYDSINGTSGALVLLTVTIPDCPAVMDTVANVHVLALPNSAITTSPGTPCVFGSKTFQPTAVQVPGYLYQWNFGAGAIPATASGYGPFTVEYSTAGSKTVKLAVWTNGSGTSCADSSTLTFTVNACPGQITGRVFINTSTTDTVGIANVTLRLYADQNLDGLADNGVIIRNVSTNALGNYSMASIPPGYYVIVELQPSGYYSIWEDDTSEDYDSLSNLIPNDNILPVTIEPNEVDTHNFFVEDINPGIITGYVFEDFNGDQAPEAGEGIAGVTINLFADTNADGIPDGSSVATMLTNGIGYYTTGGMPVGNYVLVEEQPVGYTSVIDIDPTNDGDVVPNTNMMNDTLPVTLTNGEVDGENFFIEATSCSLWVTTTEDNVPGSLRFAINCAQPLDTIFFNPALSGQSIHLNVGRIEIDKDLYLYATSTPPAMVESDISGAFKILAGNTVEFKGLNFMSGLTGYPGAAFENYGHLILWDSEVYRNPLLPPTDYLIYNHVPGDITVKGFFQLLHN